MSNQGKPPVEFPGTILIDTREQLPLQFSGLSIGRDQRQWIIPAERASLKSGDYSLRGYERSIAIERKSAADGVQTFFRGRRRFERELERLSHYEFSAILIECEWKALLEHAFYCTKANPVSVDSSIIAWMMRYPTRWVFRPCRYTAAKTVAKIFDRFLKDRQR